MEKSLIILKPDAVQRGLIGQIITRLEQRGLKFMGMKLMQVSPELATAIMVNTKASPSSAHS